MIALETHQRIAGFKTPKKQPSIVRNAMQTVRPTGRQRGRNAMDSEQMNGWFKKNFRIKNVKKATKAISIKNAVKVVKVATPLIKTAASFVPGGAVATGIIGKAQDLINKAKNSGVGQFVQKAAATKVGQAVIKNATPLVNSGINNLKNQIANGSPASSASVADSEIQEGVPNEAQTETLKNLKGEPNEAQNKTAEQLKGDGTETKKDNTLLYVAGGVAVIAVGAAVAMSKSNSSTNNQN